MTWYEEDYLLALKDCEKHKYNSDCGDKAMASVKDPTEPFDATMLYQTLVET